MKIRTETPILIDALKKLSDDILSDDGVANAAILEAAYRLEELSESKTKKEKSDKQMTVMVKPSLFESFEKKCSDEHRTISEVVRELVSKYSQGWIQLPIEFNHKECYRKD